MKFLIGIIVFFLRDGFGCVEGVDFGKNRECLDYGDGVGGGEFC